LAGAAAGVEPKENFEAAAALLELPQKEMAETISAVGCDLKEKVVGWSGVDKGLAGAAAGVEPKENFEAAAALLELPQKEMAETISAVGSVT
jgi:hypothetical protein